MLRVCKVDVVRCAKVDVVRLRCCLGHPCLSTRNRMRDTKARMGSQRCHNGSSASSLDSSPWWAPRSLRSSPGISRRLPESVADRWNHGENSIEDSVESTPMNWAELTWGASLSFRTPGSKSLLMGLMNWYWLLHTEERHAWKEGIKKNRMTPFVSELEQVYTFKRRP